MGAAGAWYAMAWLHGRRRSGHPRPARLQPGVSRLVRGRIRPGRTRSAADDRGGADATARVGGPGRAGCGFVVVAAAPGVRRRAADAAVGRGAAGALPAGGVDAAGDCRAPGLRMVHGLGGAVGGGGGVPVRLVHSGEHGGLRRRLRGGDRAAERLPDLLGSGSDDPAGPCDRVWVPGLGGPGNAVVAAGRDRTAGPGGPARPRHLRRRQPVGSDRCGLRWYRVVRPGPARLRAQVRPPPRPGHRAGYVAGPARGDHHGVGRRPRAPCRGVFLRRRGLPYDQQRVRHRGGGRGPVRPGRAGPGRGRPGGGRGAAERQTASP